MKKQYYKYANREEYRNIVESGLIGWHTEYKETELLIFADKRMERPAYDAAVWLRNVLDEYIAEHTAFGESLTPVLPLPGAPDTVRAMCEAAAKADVGPMAAVAGAFAAHVGQALLGQSAQVIVENGGDVYMKTDEVSSVAVYAGQSPVSMKIGIEVDARNRPVAVCTSSGSVGHSKSFGNADAAVVMSHDACLADACATRLGNEIKKPDDIQRALELICEIGGVMGAVAVMGETIGAMGNVQLKNLHSINDL